MRVCPFCGHQPEQKEVDDYDGDGDGTWIGAHFEIRCLSCKVVMRSTDQSGKAMADLITRWNRRVGIRHE